jgi:hypothetical protein
VRSERTGVNRANLAICIYINYFNYIFTMTMLAPSAPPVPGGSGTFSVATWNIRSGRGTGLVAAAKGLCQMRVGCMVLTKTKLT